MKNAYTKLWLERRRVGELDRIRIEGAEGTAAREELEAGLLELLGAKADLDNDGPLIRLRISGELGREEYSLYQDGCQTIAGGSEAGLLYGAFAYLRAVQLTGRVFGHSERKAPSAPLRMLDHWDEPWGDIERGYSGKSFFFRDNELIVNERTRLYARLMASVGLNGAVINNVNVRGAARELVGGRYLDRLRELGAVFSRYFLGLWISVSFAAPMTAGGLATADPCDPQVRNWWRERARVLFARVPGLRGFLVKADSEGEPGPFAYGRDHAEGANMLAEAVAPWGGQVIWRAFVYNCAQDWRDRSIDRACAGYDSFAHLDGRFADNVILQVKNGPMDFQVREPVHPLFGAMPDTRLMAEFQLAQEYTGQQIHTCYLVPMIKETLGHRTFCAQTGDRVGELICGTAGVSNTGDSPCWTGSELAGANLYGFGRLSFDHTLDPRDLAREWAELTFGREAAGAVTDILMSSHRAYENYTVPLGLGWMCRPGTHYGPDPWGYEFDRWGTYNRADRNGVGVERTAFCQQYREPLRSLYSDPKTCPGQLGSHPPGPDPVSSHTQDGYGGDGGSWGARGAPPSPQGGDRPSSGSLCRGSHRGH